MYRWMDGQTYTGVLYYTKLLYPAPAVWPCVAVSVLPRIRRNLFMAVAAGGAWFGERAAWCPQHSTPHHRLTAWIPPTGPNTANWTKYHQLGQIPRVSAALLKQRLRLRSRRDRERAVTWVPKKVTLSITYLSTPLQATPSPLLYVGQRQERTSLHYTHEVFLPVYSVCGGVVLYVFCPWIT